MDMDKIKVLVICGPTATGKTKLSIELAKAINGEIISADSMQVYKRMDIGTAKPTAEERQGITHYLMDETEPDKSFSVAKYKELANGYIKEIVSKGKIPILVGGTGLYIHSLLDDRDFGNYQPDLAYREELYEIAEKKGGEALKEMLSLVDKPSADRLHSNDIKRLVRALEVYKLTGKTITYWNEMSKINRSPYNALIFGLTYKNRDSLYQKINNRVDEMFIKGLVNEVKTLLASGVKPEMTAMQAIGYKELVRYLKGEMTLEQAKEKIKQESRRYAKRQLTWFRRDESITWFEVDSLEFIDVKNISNKIIKTMENYGFLCYNE
jgi:tRNA dimethylallyltransferase